MKLLALCFALLLSNLGLANPAPAPLSPPSAVHPELPNAVRPEPVEGQLKPKTYIPADSPVRAFMKCEGDVLYILIIGRGEPILSSIGKCINGLPAHINGPKAEA